MTDVKKTCEYRNAILPPNVGEAALLNLDDERFARTSTVLRIEEDGTVETKNTIYTLKAPKPVAYYTEAIYEVGMKPQIKLVGSRFMANFASPVLHFDEATGDFETAGVIYRKQAV